ncbi:hypothetical protein, partial [Erwinia amylovora]|uniref:hypothetical protein n=1 Tax=Erwinia amylovora TaxID=552 RepID=UPI003D03705D
NWLTALGLLAYTSYDEHMASDNLFDLAKKFTYHAPDGLDDTYVVFVIGVVHDQTLQLKVRFAETSPAMLNRKTS